MHRQHKNSLEFYTLDKMDMEINTESYVTDLRRKSISLEMHARPPGITIFSEIEPQFQSVGNRARLGKTGCSTHEPTPRPALR